MDPISSAELQHFGFLKSPELDSPATTGGITFGSLQFPCASVIKFGSFEFPQSEELSSKLPSFKGGQFCRDLWDSIPEDKLYCILDLWQAGYLNEDVKNVVQIIDVPSLEYIKKG